MLMQIVSSSDIELSKFQTALAASAFVASAAFAGWAALCLLHVRVR